MSTFTFVDRPSLWATKFPADQPWHIFFYGLNPVRAVAKIISRGFQCVINVHSWWPRIMIKSLEAMKIAFAMGVCVTIPLT
jgi:hypothetical protein